MSLLQSLIKTAIAKREFLDLSRESLYDEGLGSVRPIQMSDELLLVEAYDRAFRFDGFSIIRLEDVTQVYRGDRKLALLHKSQQVTSHHLFPELTVSSLHSVFKELQLRRKFFAIYREEFHEGAATGYVKDLDEDYLLLDWYSTVETLDRLEGLCTLDEITRIEIDSTFTDATLKAHGMPKSSQKAEK